MKIGLIVAIAAPALIIGMYAYGRWIYGENWYRVFEKPSALDDPNNDEITRLDIGKPAGGKGE